MGSGEGTPTLPLGVLLCLISQFFSAGIFVVEEKLFSKYYVKPVEAVGYEGLSGLCLYLVILPIVCSIPCSTSYEYAEGADIFTQDPILVNCPYGTLESIPYAFFQMVNNISMLFLYLGGTNLDSF